ncbi:MAG TPA: DUF4440 domain-containing protein [Gammaproteobacteria bacterium]
MRRLFLAVLLIAACRASAAAAPPQDPLSAQLIGYETRAWEDAKRKDYADLAALLADDYVDHFPNGRMLHKADVLAYLRGVELLDYSLRSFQVIRLGEGSALLLYESRARGRENAATSRDEQKGSLTETHASVISIWAKRGGRWQNVFYQETDIK